MGKGVHIQLPWPSDPPQNRNLHLHVSYQLADGRTFEASKRILIEPMKTALRGSTPTFEWSPERSPKSILPNPREKEEAAVELTRNPPSNWLPER